MTLSSLQSEVNGIQDRLNRLAQERLQLETHLSTIKAQIDLVEVMNQESPSALPGGAMLRQNVELDQLDKESTPAKPRSSSCCRSIRKPIRRPGPEETPRSAQEQRDDLQAKQEAMLATESARPKEATKRAQIFRWRKA